VERAHQHRVSQVCDALRDEREEHPVTALPALLTQVKEAVGAIGKTDTNRQQGFNFRGIDAVINAVAPALIDAGVIVVPNVRTYEHGTVEVGGKRTPMGHARVVVEYTFYGPDGDTIMCSAPGEAMDSGDKATSKAMSVAYRTFLIQALTLPTHDIDPDAESYERSPALEPPALDPLALVKAEVWAEAQRHGIKDRQTLAAHFAEVMSGAVLADADEQGLRGYLETLKGMA
jgi:hypothetical protein